MASEDLVSIRISGHEVLLERSLGSESLHEGRCVRCGAESIPPCPCRPLECIMVMLASLGCKVDGMNRNQWTISPEYAREAVP